MSLIEMMMVIAIIVILMAFLLPVFAGAIKKAKNVKTHESEQSRLATGRAILCPDDSDFDLNDALEHHQ